MCSAGFATSTTTGCSRPTSFARTSLRCAPKACARRAVLRLLDDDARLTIETGVRARTHGATAINYAE